MLTALDTLAHELAYGAARSDIECNCRLVEWGPPSYYDTAIEDAEIREEWLDRAITCLDGRGLLLRHPSNHAWVAIKDAPEQAGRETA